MQGTHNELISNPIGKYTVLVKLQMKEGGDHPPEIDPLHAGGGGVQQLLLARGSQDPDEIVMLPSPVAGAEEGEKKPSSFGIKGGIKRVSKDG